VWAEGWKPSMGFVKGEKMGMCSNFRYDWEGGRGALDTLPHRNARTKRAVLRACASALRRTKREGRR